MSDATEQTIRQEHLFIVVCGHDGSGKGSTNGRFLFELDGTSKREPDGPTPEAERLEKLSLATAFNMDDLKGKTERGGIPCDLSGEWERDVLEKPPNFFFPPRARVPWPRGCRQPCSTTSCSVGPSSLERRYARPGPRWE